MFYITVDDLSDNDSLPVYELPKESSVFDLKLEIQATEGIRTYFQALTYNQRSLEDDERLDSIIVGNPSDVTVYLKLMRHGISVRSAHHPRPPIPSATASSHTDTLDRSHPETASSHTDPLDRSHSETVFRPSPTLDSKVSRFSISSREPVKAKYDWGGGIKDSNVKGLPLKGGQKYYVIKKRSPLQLDSAKWCYGSKYRYWFKDIFLSRSTNVSKGYFPKECVSWTENKAEQNTIDTDVKVPPPVPSKPTSAPGTNVEFKFIQSFIYLTTEYDRNSSTGSTPVTITLECQPFGVQRFLAIGIEIKTGSGPSEAKVCELEEHNQKVPIDVETTNGHTNEMQFEGGSVSVAGVSVALQGGASKGNSTTITEKGKRYAWIKPKPLVKISPEGLIRWYLKAPVPVANPEGICGTESITCIFPKEPVHFKYDCQVEVILKNGDVRKVRRRSRHWSY